MENNNGINAFQRYLTVLVILYMIAGVLIGKFLPQIPAFLGRFEYANVSIPMAVLIWLMIYPMIKKVDLSRCFCSPSVPVFVPCWVFGVFLGNTA